MEMIRVPEGWCVMAEGVEKMFVRVVNFKVERGDLKILNFEQLHVVFLDEV